MYVIDLTGGQINKSSAKRLSPGVYALSIESDGRKYTITMETTMLDAIVEDLQKAKRSV